MRKAKRLQVALQLIVAACALPLGASAAVVTPGNAVTVVKSYAYTNFDGGDFVFVTSGEAAGCGSGWYVKPTDGGYRAVVAVVLTAQASGLQVIVYGDNTDLWAGSPSGQYCRVQTVGLSTP